MKDPAFLFYPNDYLGGTLGMTFKQKGAYIELMMVQFNRGHMSVDMIKSILGLDFDEIFPIIKDKFIQDENGLYYNERLEYEQNKRKAYSESRRNNKEGNNQYKSGHMTNDMLGHTKGRMENRNRNRNRNKHTIEDIILYFKENNYSEESARNFYNYYDANEWKDSNGKEVKNWKTKARQVWFVDKNKIVPIKPKSTAGLFELPPLN